MSVSGVGIPREYGGQEARFGARARHPLAHRPGTGAADSKCEAFGIKRLFGGRERQHRGESKVRASFSGKRGRRQKDADLNRHQRMSARIDE
jgi:hypothetical protein